MCETLKDKGNWPGKLTIYYHSKWQSNKNIQVLKSKEKMILFWVRMGFYRSGHRVTNTNQTSIYSSEGETESSLVVRERHLLSMLNFGKPLKDHDWGTKWQVRLSNVILDNSSTPDILNIPKWMQHETCEKELQWTSPILWATMDLRAKWDCSLTTSGKACLKRAVCWGTGKIFVFSSFH